MSKKQRPELENNPNPDQWNRYSKLGPFIVLRTSMLTDPAWLTMSPVSFMAYCYAMAFCRASKQPGTISAVTLREISARHPSINSIEELSTHMDPNGEPWIVKVNEETWKLPWYIRNNPPQSSIDKKRADTRRRVMELRSKHCEKNSDATNSVDSAVTRSVTQPVTRYISTSNSNSNSVLDRESSEREESELLPLDEDGNVIETWSTDPVTF